MGAALDFFVSYLCRWLPSKARPGLFKIGDPGPDSPVIVTCNFSLTLRRLKKALAGQDLWLLVANSDGINVWCAAGGDIYNHNRVIDAVKVTRLADKVSHRELILPALSAQAMDRKAIRDETGFKSRFGPVRADDIPDYLAAGKKKTEPMRRFRYDMRHRADMFLSMNFPIWLIMAIVLAIFARQHLVGASLLFWGAVALLYLLADYIPGRTGWGQAALAATVVAGAWMGIDFALQGDPFIHWGWLIATYGIFLAAGMDMAGIVAGRKSDPEQFLHRLGIKSMGSLFSEKDLGDLDLDLEKCTGCGTCFDICPNAAFDEPAEGKAVLARPGSCFACSACVAQCPAGALGIGA